MEAQGEATGYTSFSPSTGTTTGGEYVPVYMTLDPNEGNRRRFYFYYCSTEVPGWKIPVACDQAGGYTP